MKFKSLILFCLLVSVACAQASNAPFQNLIKNFENEYLKWNIPAIDLSYIHNLENVASVEDLNGQKSFFIKYGEAIQKTSFSQLSENDQLTLEVLQYEIELNLERIDLEVRWKSANYTANANRIYDEHLGKEWYAYFLKKWIDKDLTPEDAYHFGLKEIERIKMKMADIKYKTESGSFENQSTEFDFLLTNHQEIEEKYNVIDLKVREKAKLYFPYIDEIPVLQIEAGTNPEMAIAPAYYSNNTFYYNFFNNAYDARDMGWVYVHEAVPGHHYHNYVNNRFSVPVRDLFYYMGYIEGWGAYIEQYGSILNAYDDLQGEYAQMQWDLIRSIRVVLDVGLNFYGWSDEKAFDFWNQHLKNKEDIARREIKRMKRWPAQVITYKYGQSVLDELKGDIKSPNELKSFHQMVLEDGILPLSILRKNVQRKQERSSIKEEDYESQSSTIDQTINSLYEVISGEKGEERDWNLLQYLFHPEAKFIFSGKRKEGGFSANYVSMKSYIENSGQWMLENGFYEKELHRVTDQFGHIAQVFSTYECFHSEEDESPFMRGVNSIQLMYTGRRWQVMSIYFTQETEENPIPHKYLGIKK